MEGMGAPGPTSILADIIVIDIGGSDEICLVFRVHHDGWFIRETFIADFNILTVKSVSSQQQHDIKEECFTHIHLEYKFDLN